MKNILLVMVILSFLPIRSANSSKLYFTAQETVTLKTKLCGICLGSSFKDLINRYGSNYRMSYGNIDGVNVEGITYSDPKTDAFLIISTNALPFDKATSKVDNITLKKGRLSGKTKTAKRSFTKIGESNGITLSDSKTKIDKYYRKIWWHKEGAEMVGDAHIGNTDQSACYLTFVLSKNKIIEISLYYCQ